MFHPQESPAEASRFIHYSSHSRRLVRKLVSVNYDNKQKEFIKVRIMHLPCYQESASQRKRERMLRDGSARLILPQPVHPKITRENEET